MCGINVILRHSGSTFEDEQTVRRMNQGMRYRGPDGEGIFRADAVTLGMVRLSIIDVEGGMQPLFNETRDVALVCNGEIYNYIELRRELEAKGHHFATGSDCEVLVHLYEDEGLNFLDRVRGMFAFALWDRTRQRLVAARDRYGQKPLYRTTHEGALYLSSEFKAFVSIGAAQDSIDSQVLFDTLTLTYPPDPRRTLCRDADRVPPATMLVADHNGVVEHTYWTEDFPVTPLATLADIEQEFERTLALHLRSDVPSAILLSGGLDSSAIATFAAKSHSNITCISAGYQGEHECDEREAARMIANHLHLPFVEVELDANEFETHLPALAAHCGEPATDVSAVAQWALYSRCRELGYRVALSGVGGDEMLYGYPFWNQLGARIQLRNRIMGRWLGESTRFIERFVPTRLARRLPLGRTGFLTHPVVRRHRDLLGVLGVRDDTLDDRLSVLGRPHAPGPESTYAIHRHAYLPNNGLQLSDKLGMGQSVELRVPFVDHQLAAVIERVPFKERFNTRLGKPVLREMLRSRVPDFVSKQAKSGFAPPARFVELSLQAHRERTLASSLVRDHFSIDGLATAYKTLTKDSPWWWLLFSLTSAAMSHAAWRSDTNS